MLLASVELLPYFPEHCSSTGFWEEVLFLSHPATGAPAESHPSLGTKILLDIGVVALSQGGSEQSERWGSPVCGDAISLSVLQAWSLAYLNSRRL